MTISDSFLTCCSYRSTVRPKAAWTGLHILVLLLLAIVGTGTTVTPAHAQQDGRRVTIDDALALRNVGDVAPSPDGKWIAYVVTNREVEPEEDVHRQDANVWVVSTDGGEPVQLTRDPATDMNPQWAPDGAWLAFTSDRDDDTQVYGIRPDGGEPWQITEWDTSVGSFELSPDGKRIAFTASATRSDEAKKRAARRGRPMVMDSAYADEYTHLWTALLQSSDEPGHPEPKTDTVRQSSPDTLHVQSVSWGPDSRSLAWSARPQPRLQTYKHAAVFVQDTSGAPARRIADLPGGDGVADWTADVGLLTTGSGHEVGAHNDEIWRADPTGQKEPVSLTEDLDHDADYVQARETRLLVESPIRTGHGLYEIPLQNGDPSGEPARVDDGELFYHDIATSEDGSTLGFVAEGPTTPPNVYAATTSPFSVRQLTEVNPQTDTFALGEQRVVSWESSVDGEPIEGVLTLPVDYEEGDRVPLLVDVHGGPSGVDGMDYKGGGYAYPTQVFAGLGYAVLQPNYRGSTGYGERFRNLIRGHISDHEWADVNSGVDAMIDMGIADSERLGLMGWSYGGHQTYWGITQTDRFAAASAGAGAVDLVSMYSQTDIPAFYHTYLGPKPWEDFDLYEKRSSYRYVTNVTTPLLIQVGEEDDRVPAEQSIQFYEAVKSIGKVPAVKLVQYPGQSHGVREPRLRRDLMTRNVRWFSRWIPTDESRAAGYPPESTR